MTTQVMQKSDLEQLLKKVQRKTVDGFLVESCVLFFNHYHLSVTSLVKDGVSSVARFTLDAYSHPWQESLRVPVPDISHLLKVLKYHGQRITLTYEADKLKIASGKKTTTLAASLRAKATSSSPDTIQEWHEKSRKIASKFDFSMTEKSKYKLDNGEINEAKISFPVDSTDFFEALRCDGINGKKQGKYNFVFDEDGFHVDVGSEIKGHTRTTVCEMNFGEKRSMTFEGGLEEVMKPVIGEVLLNFHHFPKRGNGAGEWGLLIAIDNTFIYQLSVVA